MIVLPFPPASLSGHAKGNSHWGKSALTKRWRAIGAEAARASGVRLPAHGDIVLRFTFIPPDRRGDRMNYLNRCKAAIDGIAEALGVNDKRFVPELRFRDAEKPGRVEIEVLHG